jgi:gamma-glutamyltranspeptidase
VLKDGRPVLGLSAIGSGIHEESIKCLFNALGFGKGPQEAIDAPSFVPTFGNQVNSPSVAIAVAEGAFPASLIEDVRKRGLEIELLPFDQARRTRGAAAIVTVDPATGIKEGGSVRRFSLGY